LILVKLPPANTCSPSGRGQGLDLGVEDRRERGVDRPVVASKAKMLLRAIAVVGAAALATRVNCRPATILLPIWTMAATLPSSTCGSSPRGCSTPPRPAAR
jgi:hypothetical protein